MRKRRKRMPNFVARIKNPNPPPANGTDEEYAAYQFMVDANIQADAYGTEPSGTLTFYRNDALNGRMKGFMSFPPGEWFAVMELVPQPEDVGSPNVG